MQKGSKFQNDIEQKTLSTAACKPKSSTKPEAKVSHGNILMANSESRIHNTKNIPSVTITLRSAHDDMDDIYPSTAHKKEILKKYGIMKILPELYTRKCPIIIYTRAHAQVLTYFRMYHCQGIPFQKYTLGILRARSF